VVEASEAVTLTVLGLVEKAVAIPWVEFPVMFRV